MLVLTFILLATYSNAATREDEELTNLMLGSDSDSPSDGPLWAIPQPRAMGKGTRSVAGDHPCFHGKGKEKKSTRQRWAEPLAERRRAPRKFRPNPRFERNARGARRQGQLPPLERLEADNVEYCEKVQTKTEECPDNLVELLRVSGFMLKETPKGDGSSAPMHYAPQFDATSSKQDPAGGFIFRYEGRTTTSGSERILCIRIRNQEIGLKITNSRGEDRKVFEDCIFGPKYIKKVTKFQKSFLVFSNGKSTFEIDLNQTRESVDLFLKPFGAPSMLEHIPVDGPKYVYVDDKNRPLVLQEVTWDPSSVSSKPNQD